MARKKATAQAMLPLPEPITPEQEALETAERELNRSRQVIEDYTTLMQVSQAEEYALDTETERWTDRNHFFKVGLQGISVSANGRQALYHTGKEEWQRLMPQDGQRVVMHNSKFDVRILQDAGLAELTPEQFEDTQIAAFLLDENRYQRSLKSLAKDWLGVSSPMLYDEAEQKGKILDPGIFEEYARNDARYTVRLWQLLKPELEEQGLLRVYNLEKQLVPVLIDMERTGMRIDVGKLDYLRAETGKVISQSQQAIFDLAGREFNINSGQQLAEVLYDELNLPCKFFTDKGKRSTDKEAMAALEAYHKIIPHIQSYRACSKLDSSFLRALPRFVDENNRIHPTFNAQGAKTGRFSCSEPNVQQIPSRTELGQQIRKAFIPADGCKLIVADYGAMEMRVLASYVYKTTGDDSVMQLVETSDPHSETAARMFGLTVDEVNTTHKDKRAVAKWINFGIVYGITETGLGARLRAIGQDITDQQAGEYIRQYLNTYRGVEEFMRKAERATQDNGFIRNAFGRRRRLSGWTRREMRQAVNYVIQSTSADIVKQSMVTLHAMLPPGAKIIAQVHDELITECPAEVGEEVKEIVEKAMTQSTPRMVCPMVVDAKIGDSWGDCK